MYNMIFTSTPHDLDERFEEVDPPNTAAEENGAAAAAQNGAGAAAAAQNGAAAEPMRVHATPRQKARLLALIAEADPKNVSS